MSELPWKILYLVTRDVLTLSYLTDDNSPRLCTTSPTGQFGHSKEILSCIHANPAVRLRHFCRNRTGILVLGRALAYQARIQIGLLSISSSA